MASSLNFNKALTGSATSTLGTLGRSIFNSTIGTFADSETMNQIYGAISKLTNSIETTSKTIDNEALTGRNKADDLYSLIASMNIKSSADFMNQNREFMKRLMRLNKQEKDITLNAIGVDVTGESHTIKNEYVRDYEHVKGNNYLEDYVLTLPQNQQIGDETTTLHLESNTHYNYSGLHNDLYAVNQNLYPDEDNKGAFSNKWIVENQNSLMYKTKKLFNSKKIGTLISRFHTDPNKNFSLLDNSKSKFGLSHGRNLLTKKAETGANRAYVNGYDNPYCRVWTHHHQYDRLYKTIRPFSSVDDNGEYGDTIKVKDFHQWYQFSDSFDTNEKTEGKWGWKKNSNNGWQYSVLQDNGRVNITPKYIRGEASNIHTKQCMFSIENLAWRGYDPYSFEQALSWEQRGPLGGRIMWFPPYGIQFQETTTTQWSNNTFLGRGEDVYTYTNTTRTGSLSFKMVVDHPSIIDYVTWTDANKNVTDTDILRFFAGCGENDGNGLRQYAKPTPLTDEYTQIHQEGEIDSIVKEETKSDPEVEKTEEQVISFYVFYPNNYSGVYDKNGLFVNNFNVSSNVHAIPYLLAGNGAQKAQVNGSSDDISSPFANDLDMTEEYSTWNGGGYEMEENIGLEKQGYILGTSKYPNEKQTNGSIRYWKGLTKGLRGNSYELGISTTNAKRWYYRIDGCYRYPQSVSEEKAHYYNQTLKIPPKYTENDVESYVDSNSFCLNSKIDEVYKAFEGNNNDINKSEDGDDVTYKLKGNENSSVYTLAEIAYAVYGKRGETDKQNYVKKNLNIDTKRIKTLVDILKSDSLQLKKIGGIGYASKHGYVDLNKELGKNRYYTAVGWFLTMLNSKNSNIVAEPSTGQDENGTDGDTTGANGQTSGSANTLNAKKWRYARIDIELQTTKIETPSSAEKTTQTDSTEAAKEKITPSDNNNDNAQKGENSDDKKENESSVDNNTSQTKSAVYSLDNLATNGYGSNTEKEEEVTSQDEKKDENTEPTDEEKAKNLVNNQGGTDDVKYRSTGEQGYCSVLQKNCQVYIDKDKKKWYGDTDTKTGVTKLVAVEYDNEVQTTPKARYGSNSTDENRLRYDQEYHFFKVLEQKDPIVFNSLMDKLKYFDPAFHSMTPEGFNGRLTFLQQCMRQGNTVSASDGRFSKSANNLAFGRAPYCVLRLGDFYNQMIVIDNLSISYDPLVWDLNVEGVGVQPLIANVQISFKFVGGGDLTGPVRRLQNAMSFNYYANARLYDNRADRIERRWSDKTCGAIEHDEILTSTEEEKKFNEYEKGKSNGSTNTYNSVYNKNNNISSLYSTQMYK